jgi:hypothetical protein
MPHHVKIVCRGSETKEAASRQNNVWHRGSDAQLSYHVKIVQHTGDLMLKNAVQYHVQIVQHRGFSAKNATLVHCLIRSAIILPWGQNCMRCFTSICHDCNIGYDLLTLVTGCRISPQVFQPEIFVRSSDKRRRLVRIVSPNPDFAII